MFSALQHVRIGGAKQAVIIGTDVPDITSAIIQSAFDALEESEVCRNHKGCKSLPVDLRADGLLYRAALFQQNLLQTCGLYLRCD